MGAERGAHLPAALQTPQRGGALRHPQPARWVPQEQQPQCRDGSHQAVPGAGQGVPRRAGRCAGAGEGPAAVCLHLREQGALLHRALPRAPDPQEPARPLQQPLQKVLLLLFGAPLHQMPEDGGAV